MAAAATKKQQQKPAAVAAAGTGGPAAVDLKFEWAEKAGSFVLRLPLPGFRKDDFRVQVDGAGRLTVRGTRPGVAAGQASLHKVFQLPSEANLDEIAGRFEAGVLTLTMPRRASSIAGAGVAAPPTTIEEIKRKHPSVAKEEDATGGVKKGDAGVKKTEAKQEDVMKKSADEATGKTQEKKQEEVEEPKSRKQEQQKPTMSPAVKKEEEVKPKAPQAAAATPPKKPDAATGGDKAKTEIVHESLAEKVRRRGGEEEQRAKTAAPATTKEAKAEEEKKVMAAWGGWKERVQGELKVLTDMKWADSLAEAARKNTVVEAARKNKEVVAVAITAFSLGFLVSHKLFRK